MILKFGLRKVYIKGFINEVIVIVYIEIVGRIFGMMLNWLKILMVVVK